MMGNDARRPQSLPHQRVEKGQDEMKLDFTYDLKTEMGVPFTTVDCEVDCELRPSGVAISGVYIDRENILLSKDVLLISLACAIAGEAENSRHILACLEDEAAEEHAARQMRQRWGEYA
jgi:hypothetical protein